jgi:RNA polymerase sigma factor (sigma-70 family)
MFCKENRRGWTNEDVEERFQKLLAANGPALLRLAASYTRNQSDRDDLFQEISIAIWKALPRFRGDSSERTFIFRIAHNRGMSHIAKQKYYTSGDEPDEIVDSKPDPETSLKSEQRYERLLQAIRRLPLQYRAVVTLMLEGMSYAEIAEVSGLSESNIGVRLNRARDMLRSLLEE